MAEIGLPQPKERIGKRGNPESTPVLKSTEKLGGPGSAPNFGGAFNTMALTTDTFANLSSKIAMGASQGLAQKWGYEAGLNPTGNMLAPLTDFDKTFQNAYLNQSQNTLSLEANHLLIEGQNQISQSDRLSPDAIKSYSANMKEGLANIYKIAPDSIRGGLELQYESKLMSSEASLNNKLRSQNKSEAADKANAAAITNEQGVYEASMGGNFDTAKALSEVAIAQIKQSEAGGIITHTQAATQIAGIRKTLITSEKTYVGNQKRLLALEASTIRSEIAETKAQIKLKKEAIENSLTDLADIYINDAEKAKSEGEYDNYIKSLIKTKPAQMNNEDWDKVVNRVIDHFKPQAYLENRIKQEQKEVTSAKKLTHDEAINKYVNAYTETGYKIKAKQGYDEWQAGLMDSLPKDMPIEDKIEIVTNVNQNLNVMDSAQKRKENALYSEGRRLLAEGTLTPSFMLELQQETQDRARFNDFATEVAVKSKAKNAKQERAANLVHHWNDTDVMATATKEDKNNALLLATEDILSLAASKGIKLDPATAKVQAMASSSVPIPSFTAEMNTGFLSGNPNVMLEKLHFFNSLDNANPLVLAGISQEAIAMKTQFELQLEGNEPDVAAQNAKEIVQNKTEEQHKINDVLFDSWRNKKAKTVNQKISWASNLADIPSNAKVNNLSSFAVHVQNIFQSNFNLHNGNIDAANKDTKDALARSWGVTEFNGKKEYVFQPLEKTLRTDSDAIPLIKEQVYNSLKAQIEPMNQIYHDSKANKDKRMSFYYNLPERPTFENYLESANYIKLNAVKPLDILAPDKNLSAAQSIVKAYKDPNLHIERIHDSGRIERFTVDAKANPGLQIDENTGVIGDYNLTLRSEEGYSAPMNGWFKGPLSEPIFRPNRKDIQSRYPVLNGMTKANLTPEQWAAHTAVKDVYEASNISTLGRGFR